MNQNAAILLGLCIAAPHLAVAQSATGSSAARSDNWTVDPAKSVMGFSGTQTGTKFSGRFKRYEATIQFDPANPANSHATVTIDTASASTGDTQRDEAMPGADWFNAKSFPKAVFEATSFQSRGSNDYVAIGTLTIRGITLSETLPFTLAIDGDTAQAKGRLQLVRSAFGVGQGAWSSGQWVALEVGVDIDLLAHRAK